MVQVIRMNQARQMRALRKVYAMAAKAISS